MEQVQLDEAERNHLKSIVKQLRERVEETVKHWINTELNLKSEDAEVPDRLSDGERTLREKVKDAIQRERAGGQPWTEARKLYIKGVGHTLVNRLAALRCMEVRDFLDRSPTRFRDDGVTPAAERLITEHYLGNEAGVWMAFLQACHDRAEEVEMLFELRDPYSLLYGDFSSWEGEPEDVSWGDSLRADLVDLQRDLCSLIDEVDDAVWRTDDVLGWTYEYYNLPDVSGVRNDVKTKEDIAIANQFYTPHWVVRMLTDNSLGKLYLEQKDDLQKTIQNQKQQFTPEERKEREVGETSSVEELCTYLVATDEDAESTEFDHPREIRVFDPACGSVHFLLYAFDILERIWWAETDLDRAEIPSKILEHNLYGVDLDLRACQLAVFNLYLKARARTEKEGGGDFEMPSVGIACADAHVADLDASHAVFDEVSGNDDELRGALNSILHSFEQIEGLGSLLDVKGTLADLIEENGGQLDAFAEEDGISLPLLLDRLHGAVAEHVSGGSFRAKDLRSFLRLLIILTQDYDVSLMNPPYGSRSRMPSDVKKYVKSRYQYSPEFYINFFEVCDRLSKDHGRVGMLVPRSFMFKSTFQDFRQEFISGRGAFDFLAELGDDVLDNAKVRTAGTVVNVTRETDESTTGSFFRVHDVDKEEKEQTFLNSAFDSESSDEDSDSEIRRRFERPLSEFQVVPGDNLSYWVPPNLRSLYSSEAVFDAENAGLDRKSLGVVKQGMATAKDPRFLRKFWEVKKERWIPFAKGGEDAWILPRLNIVVDWTDDGREVERYGGSYVRNRHLYFQGGTTYTVAKESPRRFGLLHRDTIFGHKGATAIPDRALWELITYANSTVGAYLMLCQTPERMWEIGEVAKLPWDESLEGKKDLEELSKSAAGDLLSLRRHDFNSPHYRTPLLLELAGHFNSLSSHQGHPHRDLSDRLETVSPCTQPKGKPLRELGIAASKFRERVRGRLAERSRKIDHSIYQHFGISDDQKKKIELEIALRTNEDPRKSPEHDPDSITEPSEDLTDLVKRALLHFVFEIVEEDEDGIVLMRSESDDEEADVLAKMEEKFEEVWGQYAPERLQEVDQLLGSRTPTEKPLPNLQHWLEEDLFAFHCDEFENTPILWKLTTQRLEDKGTDVTGFSCLVDYHQLDGNVFDRLSTRYLQKRKAALQERKQAALRKIEGAGDESTRQEATQELECHRSALEQIDELESRMRVLTEKESREWADEVRGRARELIPKVSRLRERLEERLATLDELVEVASRNELQGRYTDTFIDKVMENREDWISTLRDLEEAFDQFSKPASESVEAHLYDLLPYYVDEIAGKLGYRTRNKILWAYHYFIDGGEKLAAKVRQGEADNISRQEKLVADLAENTEEEVELARELKSRCESIMKRVDSDWKTRALEEVQTTGYKPVKKHGVAINITPLAEQKIVPELVDEEVI